VEQVQVEARMMRSPGLEVEIELAVPPSGGSVEDDDLDRAIADLVGDAAPAARSAPTARATPPDGATVDAAGSD
jgi:hypothetical protein